MDEFTNELVSELSAKYSGVSFAVRSGRYGRRYLTITSKTGQVDSSINGNYEAFTKGVAMADIVSGIGNDFIE